jgi:hypothetical protein
VKTHLDDRLRMAATATADLAIEFPGAHVWLTGPLATGFAHARSDIDLHVIAADPPTHLPARTVHTTRIDLHPHRAADVQYLRGLLSGFEVTLDDLTIFRTVRAHLSDLTAVRTARYWQGEGFAPVLTSEERSGYRRWALADRVEHLNTLFEDLDGLLTAGMTAAAEVVWQHTALVLAATECVAAHAPLLGDKWLPSLVANHQPGTSLAVPTLPRLPEDPDAGRRIFAALQYRVLEALLRVWPITEATPQPTPDFPATFTGPFWLPQRYSDGWHLTNGDTRRPASLGDLTAWRNRIAELL